MAENLLKELIETIKQKSPARSQTHSAIVSRVDEEGTVWVYIAGSNSETPTASAAAEVKGGDAVNVEWRNNRLYIAGNYSNPSAGMLRVSNVESAAATAHSLAEQANRSAVVAQDAAERAVADAAVAHEAADDAQASAISANNSANSALTQLSVVEDVAGTLNWISEHGSFNLTEDTTVQEGTVYFIYQGGDYVPIAQPDPTANPSEEGWYILDVSDSQASYIMAHLAVTNAGLWVLPVNGFATHPLVDGNGDQIVDSDNNPIVDFSEDPQNADGYKVLLANSGMSIYNGEGAVVANYGTTTTIGESTKNHIYIDNNSVDVMDGQTMLATFGTETVIYSTDGTELAHFGYGVGSSGSGTDIAPYYTLGTRETTTSLYSKTSTYNVGDLCVYNNNIYVCIEKIASPENWTSSHWRVYKGNYSVALGYDVIASGKQSCAEGSLTKSLGRWTHAEGLSSIAVGEMSHAEGSHTKTTGLYCHAEGYQSEAWGDASHASGVGVIASGFGQTAIGRYNVYTTNNAKAFVVGIGTGGSSRANGFTVDRQGMAYAHGYGSIDEKYLEICVGDITARAKQIDSSLSSTSTEEAWLTAVMKAICADYPGREYCTFKGNVKPNSARFFNLQIYNTSTTSGGLPQYAFGWICGYNNGFRLFGTASYTFTSRTL